MVYFGMAYLIKSVFTRSDYLAGVELKLLALKDITVAPTALAWPGRNAGFQTASGELFLHERIDRSFFLKSLLSITLQTLLADGKAFDVSDFCAVFSAQGYGVVVLVPQPERISINQHDGILHKGLGTNQFVVRRIVNNVNYTGLTCAPFRSPRKVA